MLYLMGFPSVIGIRMPKPITDLVNLLAHVKFMVMVALFHLGVFDLGHLEDFLAIEDLPSPSSISVTKTSPLILQSIKERLPVVEFGNFIERSGECDDEQSVCAVCLSCLERRHEMRELYNCSHVFHRECLDKWVDQGQITCPLCRSMLLPPQEEETRRGGDSWIVERILYLFGEDLMMDRD